MHTTAAASQTTHGPTSVGQPGTQVAGGDEEELAEVALVPLALKLAPVLDEASSLEDEKSLEDVKALEDGVASLLDDATLVDGLLSSDAEALPAPGSPVDETLTDVDAELVVALTLEWNEEPVDELLVEREEELKDALALDEEEEPDVVVTDAEPVEESEPVVVPGAVEDSPGVKGLVDVVAKPGLLEPDGPVTEPPLGVVDELCAPPSPLTPTTEEPPHATSVTDATPSATRRRWDGRFFMRVP